MMDIEVTRIFPEVYRVELIEGNTTTTYEVGASDADVERLAGGMSGEALVEESFRFVLERDKKEVIPPTFHLLLIARYHPEFIEEVPQRLLARH